MNDEFWAFASPLRLGVWMTLFLLLALLERAWPRRADDARRAQRWPVNLGMMLLSSVAAALLPLTALGASIWAQSHGAGLLNAIPLPMTVSVAVAWLLLDATIYGQHRAMHAVPWLWRLHRVHHTDLRFDTTTAVRFHPIEILLSMAFKCAVIVALGAPALAVLIFEVMLSAAALFNHANLRVPGDRWIRRVLVTPDQHRIHHSVHAAETNSNYGNVLSVWDHLFRSYTHAPRDGQLQMALGLERWRRPQDQSLGPLLKNPLAPSNPL